MGAVIAIYNSDGLVARCDATCYMAVGEECECQACGGMNHGVGRERAEENTREVANMLTQLLPDGQELRVAD